MSNFPDPEARISASKALQAEYAASKEQHEAMIERRAQDIRDLHEEKHSWAEIGRIYEMSPQAAMYASGHAKRTPPKKAAARKKKTPKKID